MVHAEGQSLAKKEGSFSELWEELVRSEGALRGEPCYYGCVALQAFFPKWVWLWNMASVVEVNTVQTLMGCMGSQVQGQMMMVGEEASGVQWDRPCHCVLRVQAARG